MMRSGGSLPLPRSEMRSSLSLDVRMHSVTDAEAVAMSRYLVHHDGLFLGSSSACNLVACIKLVKKLGWSNGQRIVTVL